MAPDGSAVALKLWPAGFPADRLRIIHGWLQQVAQLPFVSRVVANRQGETAVEHDGQLWDISIWLPGIPDSHPTEERLSAACVALAEFHRALSLWPGLLTGPPSRQKVSSSAGMTGLRDPATTEHQERIPAILRRLALFGSYRTWQSNGGQPVNTGHAGLNAVCAEAFTLLPGLLPELEQSLLSWRDRPVPTFPCLCDVHTGHVLFTGDRVAGVIDYGAMKIDHPAVDLARYLDAATNGDLRLMRIGLEAIPCGPAAGRTVPEDLLCSSTTPGRPGGWRTGCSVSHPVIRWPTRKPWPSGWFGCLPDSVSRSGRVRTRMREHSPPPGADPCRSLPPVRTASPVSTSARTWSGSRCVARTRIAERCSR